MQKAGDEGKLTWCRGVVSRLTGDCGRQRIEGESSNTKRTHKCNRIGNKKRKMMLLTKPQQYRRYDGKKKQEKHTECADGGVKDRKKEREKWASGACAKQKESKKTGKAPRAWRQPATDTERQRI